MDLTHPPLGVGTSIWRNRPPPRSQTALLRGDREPAGLARSVGVGDVRRAGSARESVAPRDTGESVADASQDVGSMLAECVDVTADIQAFLGDLVARRRPEIFCWVLTGRSPRSLMLFVGQTRMSVVNRTRPPGTARVRQAESGPRAPEQRSTSRNPAPAPEPAGGDGDGDGDPADGQRDPPPPRRPRAAPITVVTTVLHWSTWRRRRQRQAQPATTAEEDKTPTLNQAPLQYWVRRATTTGRRTDDSSRAFSGHSQVDQRERKDGDNGQSPRALADGERPLGVGRALLGA
jgi:hypothetical protein